MKLKYISSNISVFAALSMLIALTSCGTYEYAGSDNDGIYGPTEQITIDYYPSEQEAQAAKNAQEEPRNDATYYKNYFSEKSKEYEMVFSVDEIFTDVDSYEGNYNEEVDSLNNRSYAGWGQTNSRVTINYIDNGWGWNDPWMWGDPWLWNAGWGWNNWAWGRPWGWNRWGWNARFGWGWNNWGWNAGFGWGWNNPWGWNAGFGWGWNNWGWNNFAYPYNRRGIAYNAGRRGSYLNRDLSTISRRSNSNSRLNRNSSTVRSRSSSRVNNFNRSARQRSTTRSSSPRRNSSSVSTTRRSSSRSSGSVNRSSSRSRSSGSFGRSSSGSRSGGSFRSGGASRSSSRR